MATLKANTFNAMLNDYLNYDLLQESFKTSENWLLKNVNWRKGWAGGELVVPIQQSPATSVRMGGMTAANDIDYATYLRGSIPGYKEAYGSIYFNSRDLMDHGKVSEQNFLKLLPDQLTQLMDHFRQLVSQMVLGGKALATCKVSGTTIATDVLAVNQPERLKYGMKILVSNDNGATGVVGYVTAINKNTGAVDIRVTRGDTGSALVDLAGMTPANIKLYTDGVGSTGATSFLSLRDMLLPAANGGSDTFCTLTKTSSTYTQPVIYDATATTGDWGSGTAVTGATVLRMLFDALRKGRQLGAKPQEFVCSYKHYHAILLALETGSGGFKNVTPSVSYADYSEVTVGGVAGSVKIIGVREFDDDWIVGVDTQYFDFHCSKEPFTVMTTPDGLKYFTVRNAGSTNNTDGYVYISDLRLAGEFLYRAPHTAIACINIPNYAFNP